MAKELIAQENTNSISFGNARGVRNIFERVLVNQANRLAAMQSVTREDLMRITKEDIDATAHEDGKEGVMSTSVRKDDPDQAQANPAQTLEALCNELADTLEAAKEDAPAAATPEPKA